jgi:hypothetical protein
MFFNKSKKLLAESQEQLLLTQTQLNEARTQLGKYESDLKEAQQAWEKTKYTLQECLNSKNEVVNKYASIIDKDNYLQVRQAEINEAEQRLKEFNDKYQLALKVHSELEKETNLYKDSLEIGSFGLYEPQFAFETSERYKIEMEANYEKQRQLVKEDKAVVCHTEWTVSGSKAAGKKMTNQYKKLMLFAFNGESDGLIAKVKWNNAEKTKERILKAYENINKLGETQNIEIVKDFLNLKLQEFALTYEYEQKKYEEKEEQRRIREQMREEEKAQKELERAQKEAEEEERRSQKA